MKKHSFLQGHHRPWLLPCLYVLALAATLCGAAEVSRPIAESAAGWGERATDLIGQGDLAAAENVYKRAIALEPGNADIRQSYCNLLYRLGRLDESLQQIQAAVSLAPRSAHFLTIKGEILLAMGRSEAALAAYDKAIAVAPGSHHGYQVKADYYWGEGRLDRGLEGYHKVASMNVSNPILVPAIAHLYSQLGDLPRALCWGRRALGDNADDFYTNYVMALVHLYRGDVEKSGHHLQRSLKDRSTLNPPSLALAMFRDQALAGGRPGDALALYREHYPALFKEEQPDIRINNNFAAIGIAFLYQEMGEQDKAGRLLSAAEAYTRAAPGKGWSGNRIANVLIHALSGEKQEALRALRAAIDTGWRNQWGYALDYDRMLDGLRTEPEFIAMRAEIRADLAEQLARVRTLENSKLVCAND